MEFIFSKTREQLWLWTKKEEDHIKIPAQGRVSLKELIHSIEQQEGSAIGGARFMEGRGQAKEWKWGLFKNVQETASSLSSQLLYKGRKMSLWRSWAGKSWEIRYCTEESWQWGARIWKGGSKNSVLFPAMFKALPPPSLPPVGDWWSFSGETDHGPRPEKRPTYTKI